MSLKVELKPGERLIVGNCVITNSDQRTRLFIDGKAPILREILARWGAHLAPYQSHRI